MSQPPAKPETAVRALITLGVLALLAAALWPLRAFFIAGLADVAPHAPDWALWARIPLTMQIHIIAATVALVIGTVLMFRPKGRGLHKALGWGWVTAMGITAVSSLFITSLNAGAYSLIHLLSGWTLIALPMGVYAIRRSNLAMHRRMMTGLFYFGLLVAGGFTFLPGRFMFEFLLG